ncbi:Erg28 like protein-domain-containing protein [Syncephalastrum racemosum]|uniref:Erg28 like protein-domain-containing protein n=1 Tax=Syncephalastrum racemosum TaxID=13706 RepID=A0A1X2HSP6_SYNRA|nr:Erg28 like protein-domain-containing protein [Syncephalastrum racemosum]
MEGIVATMSDLFSALPEGYLPKWLLFTTTLGLFNTVQNYMTDSLTKRVYAGKPNEVSPLAARFFATWTMSVSMIRIYAAFHLEHKFMYDLGIWTYVIALSHYSLELFVFGGCKLNGPFMSPAIVAVSSLVWMTQQYNYYVKY